MSNKIYLGYITSLAVFATVLLFILFVLIGASLPPITTKDQGLPISAVSLSDDGMILNFSVGGSRLQVRLKNAASSPPNLELATALYLDDGGIYVVNADGNIILTVEQAAPMQFVEQP